jgi:PKD repeat protein
MIREEYTGQISEIYNSHNNEKVILYSYSTTAGNRSFQQVNKSTQPIYLIDEDSVSLAVQQTITEVALYLCRSSNIRHTAPYVSLFDFCSLCKLQI